jgi:hypothetical protein
MIPEAVGAIVHHLAPSIASNLLQYGPANQSSIIKLDILPIQDDLDPWNLSRIPTPSPWQEAAEQKITHVAPPTAHRTTPSSRAAADEFDSRRCVGEAVCRKALCSNLEAIASNSGLCLRHMNICGSFRVFKTQASIG